MSAPILATKLFIPPPRTKIVLRPRLVERLNAGLQAGHKLTLISAPAGFGKTTLVSEWISGCGRPTAWLSVDEGDNDPSRFMVYFVSALKVIRPDIGEDVLAALQSPQPPAMESLLTILLNEIAAFSDPFILVLDDYHLIDSRPVDQALTYLLEHIPQQMHLAIATREDPYLPLARLRARGQLSELRAADLRFTPAEAADFLNRAMGLCLSQEDVTALDSRTEGWIAGLQLAAISMQGQHDTAGFIKSFTGSHHFVLDYLVEEVLQQQPANIQNFLLQTSILNRLCGSLCDAVLFTCEGAGQETIEYLERANLFIVPLDNERQWYRYHHLFGDLLRQRLGQNLTQEKIIEIHIRASEWYEANSLKFEAFQHAAAANDIARAERLIESKGMDLHFSGVTTFILNWLISLPDSVLDANPLLRVRSATMALVAGQTNGVEELLRKAERSLQNSEMDGKTRDLIGQIACARATLALTRYDPQTMLIQAVRALEYLNPDNLTFRFTANWAQAGAYFFLGDRIAARKACTEGISISRKSGDNFSRILATCDLGQIQEMDNQYHQAAETYESILSIIGDHPLPNAAEAYLGLAHIHYEWNDLEAAEKHGQRSLQLARQYDRVIDRYIVSEVFLARLKMARGDLDGAEAMLAQVEQSARKNNFLLRMPEIAGAQVPILLRRGNLTAADQLAQQYDLPLCRAQVLLARGDAAQALAILQTYRQQMESKGWADERLKAMVLLAIALDMEGDEAQAIQVLEEAFDLAEPEGFIRTFLDQGDPMSGLIRRASNRGINPDYTGILLTAFAVEEQARYAPSNLPGNQSLIEPLSERELEVLQLIAQGLSNREICERLFLAMNTVKGHNQRIFDKLQVQRRTEAVARARELELI